jgi:N-glycosylase/DNA lyase
VETREKATGFSRILVQDVDALSPYGFDLKGTFESGQCFRWKHLGAGRYSGIVRGKAVCVSLLDKRHLFIENATSEDFSLIWHDYFDLSTRYHPIIDQVDKDSFLHQSIAFSGGVRLLRQDFEETLFSFILSSQNNIPRIRNLVETLCVNYGDDIPGWGSAFPSAKVLSRRFCSEEHASCRPGGLCRHPFGGYRCPYIRGTAEMLLSEEGAPDYDRLAASSIREARQLMCRYPGVGEKVADCVLLYSGIHKDICPVDTWVEKTIRAVYLGSDATKKSIRIFTESYFGEYAGYAQLWFFNYVRNHSSSAGK